MIYLIGLVPFVIGALLQSLLIKTSFAKLSPTTRCVMTGGLFGIKKMPSELLFVGIFWPLVLLARLTEWLDWKDIE